MPPPPLAPDRYPWGWKGAPRPPEPPFAQGSKKAFKGGLGRTGRRIDTLQGKKPFEAKPPSVKEVHQRLEKPGGILPSVIILTTITVLVGLQELAGASVPFAGSAWEGSPTYPYQGDCFSQGSKDFKDVAALLRQAVPPSWQGAGADAYTTANDKLIQLAETMAALDGEMEKQVQGHAGIVSDTQLGIGIEQDALVVALPVIFVLEKNPTTFPTAWNSAIGLAGAAIATAVGLLGWCLGTSIQAQQAMDRLAYADVLAAAQAIVDPPASPAVPQSTGSAAAVRAPAFDSVPASSGTPSVASSPGSAGSLPSLPWLTAPTGARQRFEVDSTQVAATPEQWAPLAPAPVSGVAAVSPPSGQAANRSAGLASPGNRINPRAWPAAPDQAAHTDDGDDTAPTAAAPEGTGLKVPAAYAALGRSAAEGAPIELAAAAP